MLAWSQKDSPMYRRFFQCFQMIAAYTFVFFSQLPSLLTVAVFILFFFCGGGGLPYGLPVTDSQNFLKFSISAIIQPSPQARRTKHDRQSVIRPSILADPVRFCGSSSNGRGNGNYGKGLKYPSRRFPGLSLDSLNDAFPADYSWCRWLRTCST